MPQRLGLPQWQVKRDTESRLIRCHPERSRAGAPRLRERTSRRKVGISNCAGAPPFAVFEGWGSNLPSVGGNQNLPRRLDVHRRAVRQHFCHSLHDLGRIITRANHRVAAKFGCVL